MKEREREDGRMRKKTGKENSDRVLASLVMRQGIVDVSNNLARKVLKGRAEPHYGSISCVRAHVKHVKRINDQLMLTAFYCFEKNSQRCWID